MGYPEPTPQSHLTIYLGSSHIPIAKALQKILCVFGENVNPLPFGKPPLGMGGFTWSDDCAWLLWDLQEGSIPFWLWASVWMPKDKNESLISLRRIRLLGTLRARHCFVYPGLILMFHDDWAKKIAANLGFFLLPFEVKEILKYVRAPIMQKEDNDDLKLLPEEYLVCLQPLAHQLKNGMFLGGDSLRNNRSLAKKLFRNMMNDMEKLEIQKGRELCEDSLNYIGLNPPQSIPFDYDSIRDRWEQFYRVCAKIENEE